MALCERKGLFFAPDGKGNGDGLIRRRPARGRFIALTPEEEAARLIADRKNAQVLGRQLGDTGDDYWTLSHVDETVVADLSEQRGLLNEGAVPV